MKMTQSCLLRGAEATVVVVNRAERGDNMSAGAIL